MPYSTRFPVTPDDIDELGHVNHVVYVRWVQDVAIAHSKAVGLGTEFYLARLQAFVVQRIELQYFAPAFVGEELEIETRVVAMRAASSERRTRIRRVSDGALLVTAVATWAYVGRATGRPVRIPDEVRARFVLEPEPLVTRAMPNDA